MTPLRIILGLVIGGGLGGLMGYYGQCTSGACPLTANPYRGALIGALLGVLFASSLPIKTPAPEQNASANIIQIKDEQDFNAQILESKGICIVDFYADWCGPCKKLSPVLSKLANEFEGKVGFFKVDVDKHAALAGKYEIRGIPAVLLFKDGKLLETSVGLHDEAFYRGWIEEHMAKPGK